MPFTVDSLCESCDVAEHCEHHGRCLAECLPSELAAPVGEPAAMPPVEVGDWVSDIEAPDVPYAVRKDEQAKRCSGDLSRFVSEIRKANGVIWRRTDRKEPTT